MNRVSLRSSCRSTDGCRGNKCYYVYIQVVIQYEYVLLFTMDSLRSSLMFQRQQKKREFFQCQLATRVSATISRVVSDDFQAVSWTISIFSNTLPGESTHHALNVTCFHKIPILNWCFVSRNPPDSSKEICYGDCDRNSHTL